MRGALHVHDPIQAWAPGALHAWDFTTNMARYNGVNISGVANTPSWSFTRATVGYAQTQRDANGCWASFSSGVPRITERGLFVEAAATNLALYARDMTNVAWVKTTMTAALTSTGIDDAPSSASRLTATAGNALILQTVTGSSVARTYSVWLRRITGTGNIDLTMDGGTGWSTKTITTSWARYDIQQTNLNPVFGIRIVTNGDAIDADFSMLQTGSFASSPILTTSASATQNVDTATVTVALTFPFSLYAEVERQTDNGGVQTCIQTDETTAASAESCLIYIRSNDVLSAIMIHGGATQADVTGSNIAVGAISKMAASYDTNDVRASQAGVAGTADVSAALPTAPTVLRFGSRVGSLNVGNLYIRKAAVWQRALTTSELNYLSRN